MQIQTIDVPSRAGVTLRQELYRSGDDRERLLAIFPGRGYLVSHTVLHMLTMLGLERGYDVLAVQYGFQVTSGELNMARDLPTIHQESATTLQRALDTGGYREVVLAGKSLGTPIAATLANQIDVVQRLILLTPVQQSQAMVPDKPVLAVIGTADSYYDPAMIDDRVTWRVFDGLDHGLMVPGDVMASVRVLPDIMAACAAFLP